MAFTVTRPGGTKDRDFAAYARLLEKHNIDLTRTPRTPEPGTESRWLYVWDDRAAADAFARELRKATKDKAWLVHAVAEDQVSEGPLGPVEIDVGCQSDGCTYMLHPTSLGLLKKKFPRARTVRSVFLGTDTHVAAQEQFGDDVWDQVAILLTGLSRSQLDELGGYIVYDPTNDRVLRKPTALNGAGV
jgi:hypothetical protein